MSNGEIYTLHGLRLSYFTGKLEAYLRAKGIPYEYREMDMADFRACAKATGIAQMPQLQAPDGSWLTDTTAIIDHFEAYWPKPRLHAETADVRFAALLLEDLFDEWLWRPALYYRWAFSQDADLMGGQLARSLLRDIPGPSFPKRLFITWRQQWTFLRGDGVTKATRAQIEALFHRMLAILETVFYDRPYLLGRRPCEADFALFGPFQRHFANDPTPAAIMRQDGVRTLEWIARMWTATPDALRGAPPITYVPSDLSPLFAMASAEYLPYLEANAAAHAAKAKTVSYTLDDVAWSVPVSPYRVMCLKRLREQFAALSDQAKANVRGWLGEGTDMVDQPVEGLDLHADRGGVRDRQLRPI
ncbi:MAG: glutathione S-transferase family protein [Alphaproteobacteria bacterium]|nr:glutathione S-transferase family protein [Alphaproteobacteria bacterium]